MKILKELRNNLNLTQKELAKKLSIEQNTLSQYEADVYPSFKIIKKIAETFNVSIDFLLLENNCFYFKNIKYIKLGKEIENINDIKSKNLIKNNILNLSKEINDLNIEIKQDDFLEKLEDDFHKNLKLLRNDKNLTQIKIAEILNVDRSIISLYEKTNFPSIDKIIKLSEIFNCSIHALVTGDKLKFDFKDKNFGRLILLSDHLLSIEDKNFIIKLMGNILKK